MGVERYFLVYKTNIWGKKDLSDKFQNNDEIVINLTIKAFTLGNCEVVEVSKEEYNNCLAVKGR